MDFFFRRFLLNFLGLNFDRLFVGAETALTKNLPSFFSDDIVGRRAIVPCYQKTESRKTKSGMDEIGKTEFGTTKSTKRLRKGTLNSGNLSPGTP